MRFGPIALAALAGIAAVPELLPADGTSSEDKLRILYASRVTFNDDSDPLVTIEIMGGQSQVTLSAAGGLIAQPDGDGGSEIRAGDRWTISVEEARPAVVREWTVVARLAPDREADIDRHSALWAKRGHRVRAFEIGSLFAVDGAIMDSRTVLIAVDPRAPGKGASRARRIADRYDVITEIHRELVERPRGTIVARSGETVVRNPSVIWFAARAGQHTIEVADVVTGHGGSSLETDRETRRYFGHVYVAVGADGKLSVVNALPSERLLAGLVPSEMFPSAPLAALESQSIAARTELLQKIGTRHLEDPFLLCASQHCQVYSGAGREHPRTNRAIANTRGMVLTRTSGALIDARYSASCGGHGEHNDHIWGGQPDPSLRGERDAPAGTRDPWAGGVSDAEVERFLADDDGAAYCARTRYSKGRHRWTKKIDAADVSSRIARHYPGVGRVTAIEPGQRGVSGRIRTLLIRGQNGAATVEGDLAIRRLLGGLKSALFTVRTVGSRSNPDAFVFRGAGFGHGVGMCQLGAIGMAEANHSARAILSHYYPGSRLHTLY